MHHPNLARQLSTPEEVDIHEFYKLSDQLTRSARPVEIVPAPSEPVAKTLYQQWLDELKAKGLDKGGENYKKLVFKTTADFEAECWFSGSPTRSDRTPNIQLPKALPKG